MGSTESKSTKVADAYLMKGIAALSVGKTVDAIKWLEAANSNGNPKGLTLIAGLFEDGLGVEADFNKAFHLYLQAADQNEPEALSRIAFFYLTGRNVPEDFRVAADFHLKAADGGYAISQCDLARMYHEGIGLDRDLEQAVKWYKAAAAQGHALAQMRLGQMFLRGQGIAQDLVKAVFWHEQAAKMGYVDAQCELARLKQDQHHADLRDPDGAIYWSRKAAEQGSVAAIAQIGYCYEHGIGTERDLGEAASHYAEAASKGNWGASFSLGTLYEHGEGVTQDFVAARKCYEIAADQGHPSALYNLGHFYQFSRGVPQDFEKAFGYYLAAAEHGHGMAQLLVGQTLSRGLYGIETDETVGFAWMQRAAESGIPEAEAQLGFMHTAGKGTPADPDLADYWHRRAAMNGNAWAQFRLAYSIIRAEGVKREQLVEAAKWLILSFNQPEEPGERRHDLIQGDWDYLSATLSDTDLDEAQRQANAAPEKGDQ